MNPLTRLRHHWEYVVLFLILLSLALYLAGYKFFGISPLVGSLLALLGGLLGTIISFILAALIVPLIALVTGAITALVAAVTGLLGFLIGGIFTPLAALLTGWVTSIFAWLATTWLGSLLMPLYTTLAPLVLKIAPWITVSKTATTAYQNADKVPLLKRLFLLSRKPAAKPKAPKKPTAPSRRKRK